jgi:hypothetical protein
MFFRAARFVCMTISTRVLLLIALLGGSAALAMGLVQDSNQSQALVKVSVSSGRLVVDRKQSSFLPSSRFKEKSRLYQQLIRHFPEQRAQLELVTKIQSELFDDLDKCFAMTPKLYWWLLSPGDRQLDSAGQLKDSELKPLTNFTGSYADFKTAVEIWVRSKTGQFNNEYSIAFERTLSQLSLAPISIETKTALIYDSTDDSGFPNFDAGPGSITFRVADPVDGSDYQVTLKGAGCGTRLVADRQQIISLLQPLSGGLWRSVVIRDALESFYANLGYQATLFLSEARDPQKTIQIEESPHIARVVFDCSAGNICNSPEAMAEALYILLPDSAFRSFISKGQQVGGGDSFSSSSGFKAVTLSDLIQASGASTCPEPYLNLFKLQGQQLELAQLGMVVSQSINAARSTGDVTYVDLQVQKMIDSGGASGQSPENVIQHPTPTTTPQGLIDPHQQAFEQQPGFTPVPQLQSGSNVAAPATGGSGTGHGWDAKERNNYVGGGFEYRPGQGVSGYALFQRSRLVGDNDSASIKIGGQNSVLSSINYFADYLFFDALHRRLSLRLTAASDLQSSRVFGPLTANERRTGGSARLELELFRDLGGNQLRFFVEGERKTVQLESDGTIVSNQNLTTLDAGGYYYYQSEHGRYPLTARLQPTLRFGLGASSEEPRFLTFSVDSNYHQKLPRLYELDITGKVMTNSSGTPLFEQASFGGGDVVRGFRQDDAIGRRMWSIQSEIWTPVPGIGDAPDSLSSYIKRNVRLAFFVDVGGIYETSFSEPGTRTGPGLGARIIRFPLVIKLDWAYGVGKGVTGSGRGRFYVSFTTNLPF